MKNLSTLQTTQEKAALMGGQQIAGMPLFIFLGLATCVLFSGWNGSLPLGMVGALALMFVLGTLLTELGERIMPIREYLGAAPSSPSLAAPPCSNTSCCRCRRGRSSPIS